MSIQQDISDLLLRIRLGEDSWLELKEITFDGDKVTGPNRESLAQELAAFANSNDGVLVLGVNDKTRDISGIPLEKLDLVEQWVRNLCTDLIDPELPVRIQRLELPDRAGVQKPVLRLDIAKSLFVHSAKGRHYYRLGGEKRPMSAQYLERQIQQRSQARLIRFDELPVPGATLDVADAALSLRFFKHGDDDVPQRLAKLNLARKDESGQLVLSVTGVLLLTRRPADYLRHAYIQCVAYGGENRDSNEQIDAQDCDGPLDEQIEQTFQFVRKNMFVAARKRGGRIDYPQYDLQAVFEAVVNAAAHRDYSLAGSHIRLHMFADRLELASPGALPNSMSVDTLVELTSTRNETLAHLLARYYPANEVTGRRNLIEQRGEGVPIILEASERLSGVRPEYRVVGEAELILTLWAAEPPTEEAGMP